ncbi:MAG: DMT family transporter [Eubacteriales bacterium]
MTKNKSAVAVLYALLAAVFYAINTPFSKILLNDVPATFMAAFLYMGAGFGVGIMYLFHIKKEAKPERLTKKDLPYTIGMIALDILAPILLMIGINVGSASNASLLGNFEIVATTVIALLIFKETVSGKLWTGIAFITISSLILSFEGNGSFQFSYGSLFVILATLCWGLENNCTRKISEKSTYEIVVLKGVFSGGGSFLIALIIGERLPNVKCILYAMALGFIAYGLSIFLYVRAQRDLGASKTSAFYAVAPFIGAFLAFAVNGEKLTWVYFAALVFMLIGSAFVVYDTLVKNHNHK